VSSPSAVADACGSISLKGKTVEDEALKDWGHVSNPAFSL